MSMSRESTSLKKNLAATA